jgi:VTC domain
MFREIYYPRYVNNIYYETIDRKFYDDNVVGIKDRKKFRIRWYNDLYGDIEKPILEIKIKNGLLGRKVSYKVAPFRYTQKTVLNQVAIDINSENAAVNPDIQMLKTLSPIIVNRYKRQYFESYDKDYRITVDSEMSYNSVERSSSIELDKYSGNINTVLELKYNSECSKADIISNQFPFRMTKSSKYVVGVDLLHL